MTDTKTITHSDLITRLTAEGFEADWDCLGGDWWGVVVGNYDGRTVIITGGDGGNGAKRDDLLTHCGVGFYHESDWVADMPEAPTDWDEFVSLIRAWFTEGSIDGKSYKEAG
jgi:hypothetical protein